MRNFVFNIIGLVRERIGIEVRRLFGPVIVDLEDRRIEFIDMS